MIVSMIDVDETQQTLWLFILQPENLKRMKKADPVTLESESVGGILTTPRYPGNMMILLAYEEDEEKVVRSKEAGMGELLFHLMRGRPRQGVDAGWMGLIHDVKLVEQSIVMLVILPEKLALMEAGNPITMTPTHAGGIFPHPTYPDKMMLLIAYEENLGKWTPQGTAGDLIRYLERGRVWKEGVDGLEHVRLI